MQVFPADLCLWWQRRSLSRGHPQCPDPLILSPTAAIRFGRMPEAEKRKLVAGLTANEISCQNPQVADLKAFSKHIYNAYLKNFNMTKKKARGILTGKASSTPVSSFPGASGVACGTRGVAVPGEMLRVSLLLELLHAHQSQLQPGGLCTSCPTALQICAGVAGCRLTRR